LRAAASGYRTAGRPLAEGYAWEILAVLLAGQESGNDAGTALDAALERYQSLDARWDARRARTRLASLGVRRRGRVPYRARTGWAALTDTERRVAELVADFQSNSGIAAHLYLSRRTVQSHVSHILAKLELTSRVELAVAAYRHSGGASPGPA
jgi:DNA-binding NarL/FixJ family response regulator